MEWCVTIICASPFAILKMDDDTVTINVTFSKSELKNVFILKAEKEWSWKKHILLTTDFYIKNQINEEAERFHKY